MWHMQALPLRHEGAVRTRAALFSYSADTGNPLIYRAKVADAFFRTARPRLRFRKKSSSPFRLRYFSRKPCLSGSLRRKALVVQRAAEARVFTTNKTIRIMRQATITRQPSPAPTGRPVARRPKAQVPETAIKLPPRGSGPVHISALLNPILEICSHPDRDRLLAEFLRDA